MVRFGSVKFFSIFGRTTNWTNGPVQGISLNLEPDHQFRFREGLEASIVMCLAYVIILKCTDFCGSAPQK
jgi:hypothetical protein